jgi:gamma-glutamylcyclotransferase (GGCT)/AIG2-like uncharacterized protein YtfP
VPADVIFVYGTLRSEFSGEYALLLRANAEFLGPATVRGSIYRVAHYPGYREEPDGVVYGEIYRLREPKQGDIEKILARLDDYEGEEFERMRIGDWWIYRYVGPVAEERRIESGDFLKPSAA